MASTISKLPSLEPFLNLITPTIRCQVDESGSASPHSDDSEQSNLYSSRSDDDQEDSDSASESEQESDSWVGVLQAAPERYEKPLRLSKHTRVGRVAGERVSCRCLLLLASLNQSQRLPYAEQACFDILVGTPTISVHKVSKIQELCAIQSDECRLTLLRRPSGFGKSSLLGMFMYAVDVNHREEFSRIYGKLPAHDLDLEDDVLVLDLNLDRLPSDVTLFRAGLISYLNGAFRSFLMRYRDLLRLTHHEINSHIYNSGRPVSIFSWVMDLVYRRGYSIAILIDNLNAPLIKSTEDNIDDIRGFLDRYLVDPIQAAMHGGPIVGGVAVASPLSDEPHWTRFPPAQGYRDNLFDEITIDKSEWKAAHRALGFSQSEVAALAAECLPTEDVEPFIQEVVRTLHAYVSEYEMLRTYSMSDVLAKLRQRTGQRDNQFW
ncbi:hypothetical protein BDZ89DRAFT_1069403 [Hymenopellis radicata]|nr:hypothetical protein BDZ89DRAFT_1069403 [Hymenopellis radicata]